MVEVFKTNVCDPSMGRRILDALHARCALYVANFDLQDRDRVLRVKCLLGEVDAAEVIALLNLHGITAQVLPDDIPHVLADVL